MRSAEISLVTPTTFTGRRAHGAALRRSRSCVAEEERPTPDGDDRDKRENEDMAWDLRQTHEQRTRIYVADARREPRGPLAPHLGLSHAEVISEA